MVSEMLIFVSSFLLAADSKPRAWLDKNGETIAKATLEKVDAGSAFLKTEDGEVLVVSLDVLSDADRVTIDATTPRVWSFKDGASLEAILVKKSGLQVHFKASQDQTRIVSFESLAAEDQRRVEDQLRRMRLANPRFVRVTRNRQDEPERLETSIARYVSGESPDGSLQVDLVSAVHVGDRTYYDRLNEELKNYDVVLYEFVAPKDKAVPQPGTRSRSTVGDVQRIIRDVLQFEHQLDGIDYTVENFVHADMTPEQLSLEMQKRGESSWNMFVRMLENIKATPADDRQSLDEEDLVLMLFRFAKNPSLSLRRAMAEQMADVEGFVTLFEHPGGSAIITGRNEEALKALRSQIDDGKRKIAIFYGAGHMPGLEKSLMQDFDLQLESERWIPAWDMSNRASHDDDVNE
jgi:hypothetical protein